MHAMAHRLPNLFIMYTINFANIRTLVAQDSEKRGGVALRRALARPSKFCMDCTRN